MATILIFPYPETGHLIPTFPLARMLKERGHRVVYATILDLEPQVEAQGFECVTVLRDIYPRGYLARLDETDLGELGLAWKRRWTREVDEIFAGRLLAQLETVAPDLILVDVINAMVAMAARTRALPCLHYSTSLSQRIGDVPPILTELPFDAGPVQREAAAQSSGCLVVWGGLWWQIHDHALIRFEYDAKDVSFSSTHTPDLSLVPDLVLPPAALDFPHPPTNAPVHVSVPIDVDRAEQVPPELERFIDGRPAIYVSLGTQAHRYASVVELIRAVFVMLRERPDWQAVVVAGKYASTLATDCPSNVLLLARAPQLWMLRRAAVFITHAGMGGMREAIELGVPMIAIPQGFDQPGNAVRIEYHGIGVHLPPDVINAARLTSCVDRVLRERDKYQDRLRQLKRACDDEIREARAIRIIDERLQHADREPPREPALGVTVKESNPELGWMFVSSDGVLRDQQRLEAGVDLEAPTGVIPSLGHAGFTMCPDIGHALLRAEGSLLARVEVRGNLERTGPYVTGRTLRCLWQLDASALLWQFAFRCAENALEVERTQRPEIAGFFLEALASHLAGSDRKAELERLATPRLHRGYAVGLEALEVRAHDAARFARDSLILFRCRTRVQDAPPSAARYLRERTDVIHAIDAELLDRVAAAAKLAAVVPDETRAS